MSKQNVVENAFVQCPYYKCERQSVIFCEGAEENSSIHMAFSSSTQRKQYEKQFCQQCWKNCMIADAHNRRWDYEA
jgi:hypothetical protein